MIFVQRSNYRVSSMLLLKSRVHLIIPENEYALRLRNQSYLPNSESDQGWKAINMIDDLVYPVFLLTYYTCFESMVHAL